ncbi:MAG TPA: glycosyl hydrolase, partial [Acidimicrobiia bacterium]|nr:glycosyl hydrolase [Acidimicrobiia bacterium]
MPGHPAAGSPADEATTPVRPRLRPTRRLRRGRAWRALVLAAVVASGALPVAPPPEASAAAARPDGPLVPQSGFYVGAYTKHPSGYSADKQRSAILQLESDLGRRLHIDHHFYSWSDNFPSWREPWDLEHDRIPMISWNGNEVPTSQIAAGTQDGLIVSRAQAVRDLGEPVFVRWFWEMDGNKKAQYAESGESYVRAWRRIVDIFRSQGASNAVWVWCPNASAVGDGKAMPYYPGPEYVDWVCGDGYNFAPNRPGDRWRTFAEIFDDFYAAALKLKKPIMIGEVGALERDPGEKGAWFHQAH